MNADEKTLNLFTTRVRQLILDYRNLKAKVGQLQHIISVKDEHIAQLEKKLEQAEEDYKSLKTARMLSISNGDLEGAKNKVASLIRDVDKCITLLNEK